MRDWLVHIRKGDHASLQAQIREALVSAILDGQLAREEPIPSTRKMAKVLGVSRNTVVLAYQGLLDDGYLSARERSGYYVSEKAFEGRGSAAAPVSAPAPSARIADAAWAASWRAMMRSSSRWARRTRSICWRAY